MELAYISMGDDHGLHLLRCLPCPMEDKKSQKDHQKNNYDRLGLAVAT
jgi:hypothetical protein